MSSKRHYSSEPEEIVHIEYHWARFVPVILVVVGLVQFALGVSAAVRHFPRRFSFQSQFLSELGQTQIDGGLSNQTSCMIFTATIVLMGLCLIPMFLTIKDHFGEPDPPARLLGVTSAITLICIGITPFDRVAPLHLLALGSWLLSLGGLGILRVIRTVEVGGAAAWSGIVSCVLVLSIVIYVLSFGNR